MPLLKALISAAGLVICCIMLEEKMSLQCYKFVSEIAEWIFTLLLTRGSQVTMKSSKEKEKG